MPQYPPDWRPPEKEKWSIPPVITEEAAAIPDSAIRLRQGIICEVKLDSSVLFQNVNDNNDDIIEFSYHGDKDGIWSKLDAHMFVRTKATIFFLNRTHKDELYLAVIKQQ